MALTDVELDQVVGRTVDLYEEAQLLMLGRMSRSLAAGLDTPEWVQTKLLELQMVTARLRRDLDELSDRATGTITSVVVDSYNRGQIAAAGALAGSLGGHPANPFVSESAAALAQATVSTVTGSHRQILRSAQDMYRAVIAEASGIQLTGAATQRELAGRAMARFAAKGITGFKDSAGRNWDLRSYVEMAMRTAAHGASETGHAERLAAEGHDLVMVSDHRQECDLCRPFEGRVLSLSGRYAGSAQARRDAADGATVDVLCSLAEAKSRGYGHPNCRHRLVAYFPGITTPPPRLGGPGEYALREEQRRLERGVRAWKRREVAALDPREKAKAKAKAKAWAEALRAHEARHGLKHQGFRSSIGGKLPPAPSGVFPRPPRPPRPVSPAALSVVPDAPEPFYPELDAFLATRAAPSAPVRFGGKTPGQTASSYGRALADFRAAGYSAATVAKMETALRAMDSLGVLPEGVDYRPIRPRARSLGAYHPNTALIEVSKKSANEVMNTLAHETGHLIDWAYFEGKGLTSKRRLTPDWVEWLDKIRATRTVRRIYEMGKDGTISPGWSTYARTPEELWARSFAQWVAVRSGDPAMLAELRVLQQTRGGLEVWSDAEFEELLPVIDRLMRGVRLGDRVGVALEARRTDSR